MGQLLVAFHSFVSGACFLATLEAIKNGNVPYAAILMFFTCLNALFAYRENQREK